MNNDIATLSALAMSPPIYAKAILRSLAARKPSLINLKYPFPWSSPLFANNLRMDCEGFLFKPMNMRLEMRKATEATTLNAPWIASFIVHPLAMKNLGRGRKTVTAIRAPTPVQNPARPAIFPLTGFPDAGDMGVICGRIAVTMATHADPPRAKKRRRKMRSG